MMVSSFLQCRQRNKGDSTFSLKSLQNLFPKAFVNACDVTNC